MGAYAEVITIPSLTLQPGEESSVEIRMDQAPHGLSGYTLTIETQGSATITSGEGPTWAALKNVELVNSHTLSVSAGDLMDEIKPGNTQILLATVVIAGATGQTTLTATIKQMDDDNGNAIVPVVIPGKINSGSSPTPTTLQPTTQTTAPATPQPTIVPTTQTTAPATPQPTISPTDPIRISYDLDQGWNLIGIPAQPMDGYTTASVFSEVPSDGHSMFQYGPSGWESMSPTTPLHAMGAYWIYASTPFTVAMQVQDGPGSRSFHSGWNLISPPGFREKEANEVFSPLLWSYLMKYDGKIQQYDRIVIMGADDSPIVYPGHGYWIYLQTADTVFY